MLSLKWSLCGFCSFLVLASYAAENANAQQSSLRIVASGEDAMWVEPSHALPHREIDEPLGHGTDGDEFGDLETVRSYSVLDHDASAHPGHLHEMEHEGPEATPSACGCGKKKCRGVCRDPGHPKKPKRKQPGDIDRGDCPGARYRMSDFSRSGKPTCVHRFAECSVDDSYSAWFVGGGAAFFKGRPRKSSEGTWGLDYDGLFGKANNWLKYTRGREQGGEGAYATDGEPEFVSKLHGFLGHGH